MPYWFMILVTLTLLAWGISSNPGAAPDGHSLHLVELAVVANMAAILLAPMSVMQSPARTAATGSSLVTLAFVAVLMVLYGPAVPLTSLLRLAVTVWLMLFATLLMLQLLPGAAEHRRAALLTAFVVLGATPIWLGPVVEATGNPLLLTNLVVAVSPLCAISVALDIDLLRSGWFYTHSVLGSLRYDYLSWISYVGILGTLCCSIILAARHHSYIKETEES
jgi:hypothetical protein